MKNFRTYLYICSDTNTEVIFLQFDSPSRVNHSNINIFFYFTEIHSKIITGTLKYLNLNKSNMLEVI